ncbi:MAG: DNA topoisomerase, partial [Acidaminobacteraceae bacterium]
ASLINRADVESVISATDYDREGQIIGDIILDFLNVEKPIERLLLNEWTPDEVNGGLAKTIDNTTMSNLKDAGICRQFADWIIGINLTSVTTLKYQRGSGKPLNIGRVLLPTLKIVYDRDKEIEEFVPEEFHRLLADFKTEASESVDSTYRIENNEKFDDKKILEDVLEKVKGHKAKVSDKLVETKKEYAPALFNLSNLQGYVTSKENGWTSDKVLKVAQELYEKKIITYPRTSSVALDESLVEKTKKVLNVHKKNFKYEDEIKFTSSKRVFDNKKVESHSAIIPTYMVAKSLSKDEQVVYNAVRNRFLMQFMPIAEYEEAMVTIDFIDVPLEGSFITKGRIQLVSGWKKIENIQSKDKILPNIEVNQELENTKNKIETKGTKPPKKHNEKTLLKIMETCGKRIKQDKIKEKEVFSEEDSSDEMNEEHDDEMIDSILSGFSIGTPATRAETIKKLKQVGYLDAKGKNLYVTDMGRRLVELYPIKELFDLEYTGRLEKTLSEIEKGNFTREKFLGIISDFTVKSVDLIKNDKYHVINELESNRNEGKEILGKCPNCGSDVFEGEKGFG